MAAMKAKKLAELTQKLAEDSKEAEGSSAVAKVDEPYLMNMPGQEQESEDDSKWRSMILDNELKLCSKMLAQDERNFHCWSYRNQQVHLYCKEIELRLKSAEASMGAKNWFLQQECDMAMSIIKRNFSNYSAWHYRGKLLSFIT
mmetsp:Transcript_8134/g.9763  ORF Transcript_8134/g.9763 Transcript_8134/m.9763 type:complete len:144 (+) Transcript_8134:413-844(+)